LAYDRLIGAQPEARHFTNKQLLEEARNVHVAIYSATWCPSCDAAKSFLWKNDIPFEEHDIDKEKDARDHWVTLNPAKTIPVIDIEGDIVVGADAEPIIRALLRASERHLSAAAAMESHVGLRVVDDGARVARGYARQPTGTSSQPPHRGP
jgi:glutaredoxin 3